MVVIWLHSEDFEMLNERANRMLSLTAQSA